MSPHEIDQIKGRLFPACERLGWVRVQVEREHERDDRSWTEDGWGRDGEVVVFDTHLTRALAEELIRLAALLAG